MASHTLKLKAVLDSSDVQNKLNQLRQTQNKTLGRNGTPNVPALGNLPSILSQLNSTLRQLNQNIQKMIGTRSTSSDTPTNAVNLGLMSTLMRRHKSDYGIQSRGYRKDRWNEALARSFGSMFGDEEYSRYVYENNLLRIPVPVRRMMLKEGMFRGGEAGSISRYFDPRVVGGKPFVRRPSTSYPGRTDLSYDDPYGRNRPHQMSNWVRWGIGTMVAGQVLGAWEQSWTPKQKSGFRPVFTDALQGTMMGAMAGGIPGAALGLLFGAGTGVIRSSSANKAYLQALTEEKIKNINDQQKKEEFWLEQNRAIRLDQKRERNQLLYGNFSIDQYGNIEDPERFTKGLIHYSREIADIQEKIYNLGDLDTIEKQNEYLDLKKSLDYEMTQKQKLLDIDKKALEIRKAYKKAIEEEISLQQLEINAQMQAAFITSQQNVQAQGGGLYDYSSSGLYALAFQDRINQAKNTKTNLWGNFQKYSNQAKSYRKSYKGLLSDIESRSLIAQDENEIQALNNLKNEAEETKQKLNEASSIATIFGNAEISRLQNLLTNLIAPDQTQVTSLASSGKFIHNQNDNDKWSEHINYLQTQTKLQREIRDKVKEMDSYSTFN